MAVSRVGLGGPFRAYGTFTAKSTATATGSYPRATRGRYRYRAGQVYRVLLALLLGGLRWV